jgi:predicted lipoprotein with Yx(FWY)xxD motif
VSVEATEVGSLGTVLVAGSNGMTVYTFTMDVKDSGASNCTGDCLVNWPALTVPAGVTPTGGPGVTGTLGSLTRVDDGTIQVTCNGLPLYFFVGDTAPGDSNGVYTSWEAVAP